LRIVVVTLDRFGRVVYELAKSIKTPTVFHIYSFDQELEVIAREVNAVFKRINSLDELHGFNEISLCDIGIVALDKDSETIAAGRILKSMGVPMVFTVLNNSVNRDLARREGLKYILSLDTYIVGNILTAISMDSWSIYRVNVFQDIGVAIYRFWRRGLLGIKINILSSLLRDKPVKLVVVSRDGGIVLDEDYELKQGDMIMLIGRYVDLFEYVDLVNKTLDKFEETFASKYYEAFRATPRALEGR